MKKEDLEEYISDIIDRYCNEKTISDWLDTDAEAEVQVLERDEVEYAMLKAIDPLLKDIE